MDKSSHGMIHDWSSGGVHGGLITHAHNGSRCMCFPQLSYKPFILYSLVVQLTKKYFPRQQDISVPVGLLNFRSCVNY
jgi:hypothetical protein